MAEGGSLKAVPSFEEIMRQQLEEETAARTDHYEVSRSSSSKTKRKSKQNKAKIIKERDTLVRRGPLEESFHAAQNGHIKTTATTRKKMSPKDVNDLAKQMIEEIADEGRYVSLELVKAKMCKAIGLQNLKLMGYRNPDIDIPELKELQRLHSKVRHWNDDDE